MREFLLGMVEIVVDARQDVVLGCVDQKALLDVVEFGEARLVHRCSIASRAVVSHVCFRLAGRVDATADTGMVTVLTEQHGYVLAGSSRWRSVTPDLRAARDAVLLRTSPRRPT
jgi:hypothetical protein